MDNQDARIVDIDLKFNADAECRNELGKKQPSPKTGNCRTRREAKLKIAQYTPADLSAILQFIDRQEKIAFNTYMGYHPNANEEQTEAYNNTLTKYAKAKAKCIEALEKGVIGYGL